MNFYLEGQSVEFVIPFKDGAGSDIVPTQVSAVLNDHYGELLIDFGDLVFGVGDTQTSVVIQGNYNNLIESLREARQLVVTFQTASGTVVVTHGYGIEAEQSIQIAKNSFQTMQAADVAATDLTSVTAWNAASEERKRAALVEAFSRISAMTFGYYLLDQNKDLASSEPEVVDYRFWINASTTDFLQLPQLFRHTLARAQLVEANALLEGNIIAKKITSGIVSETIGESSVKLSATQLKNGVAAPTYEILASYVLTNNRIGRG